MKLTRRSFLTSLAATSALGAVPVLAAVPVETPLIQGELGTFQGFVFVDEEPALPPTFWEGRLIARMEREVREIAWSGQASPVRW